ncbi:MAG: AAA family ATPase [Metamycoplasmataceae bacterium]
MEIKSRKVIIENYRNIFTPTNEQHSENGRLNNKKQLGNTLILNHNNKEGGVVLLIGPNNSGKSNVLNALEFYKYSYNGTIKVRNGVINVSDNDIYNRNYSEGINNYVPDWFESIYERLDYETKIIISNDIYSFKKISESEIFIDENWNKIVRNQFYKNNWTRKKEVAISSILHECKINLYTITIIAIHLLSKKLNDEYDNWQAEILEKLEQASDTPSPDKLSLDLEDMHNWINEMISLCRRFVYAISNDYPIRDDAFDEEIIKENDWLLDVFSINMINEKIKDITNDNNKGNVMNSLFDEKENEVNIIKYDHKISIETFPNAIFTLSTISNLFNLEKYNSRGWGYDKILYTLMNNDFTLLNKFQEIYNNNSLKEENKIQLFDNLIIEINNKMSERFKIFNELYFDSSEEYGVEFVRKISKENNSITISSTDYALNFYVKNKEGVKKFLYTHKESLGFRWFFTFFFTVLSNNKLKAGDIILLEEPAVHLHVQGQRKWMEFIREFAKRNKITFVITTHSPFLIDPDRLDEIRIVYKDGKYSKINNYFYINVDENSSGKDSLKSIKEAMTFQNMTSILYNNKHSEYYLVEGITDYALLTFFKRIDERFKDLHFIPINGVGSLEEKDQNIKSIIQNIIDVYGQNVKIIVDNDEAGKRFETLSKDHETGLRIINLSSIDKTNIESLFKKEDLKIIQNSKNSNNVKSASKSLGLLSLTEKPEEYFSRETINNFKNLFEILLKP